MTTRLCFFLGLFAVLLPIISGGPIPTNKPTAYPDWWFQRDVIPRLNPSNATPAWPQDYPSADDYAAINQGQIKNFAKQGYEEIKAQLGSAGGTLDAIWANPAASTDDYAAINLGQLKNVAKPFYDRLQQIDATIHYPWTGSANAADDYALANIGQVKNLFSFDPAAILAAVQPPAPDPLAPQVLLIAPAEYTTADHATLNARVTLAQNATLATLTFKGQASALHTGDFTEDVTLVAGVNTFVLTAVDNAGRSRSATATITRANAAPQVAITSPASGTTIAASSINISGTVSAGAPLKSVTVNGVMAYVNGGTFEAPAVPLVNGANTILVTAVDILGNTSTASISITAQLPAIPPGSITPPDPVVLMATPIQGAAPLNVMFAIQVNAPGTVQQVVYDFEGTHKNLQTVTNVAPIAHTYTDSADFYPVVTVKTSAGIFSSKGGPTVPVANRLCIKVVGTDGPLVAWGALKRLVTVGDFPAAAEYIGMTHRDGLTAMLADLGPVLAPKLLTDFGELQQVSLNDDVAQYCGDISTPDGVITFCVDFIKEDGKWKVSSF